MIIFVKHKGRRRFIKHVVHQDTGCLEAYYKGYSITANWSKEDYRKIGKGWYVTIMSIANGMYDYRGWAPEDIITFNDMLQEVLDCIYYEVSK
jgi:hypothetical protein